MNSCSAKQFWETQPISRYAPFSSFEDAKQDIIDQIKELEEGASVDGGETLAEDYCHLAEDINLEKTDFEIVGPNNTTFSVSVIDGQDLHRDEYSRASCECCNTALAGARYALVGYNPTSECVEDIGEVCVDCYESLMGAKL